MRGNPRAPQVTRRDAPKLGAHRAGSAFAVAWIGFVAAPAAAQTTYATASSTLLEARGVTAEGRVLGGGNGQFRTWLGVSIQDHGIAVGFDFARALGGNDAGELVGDNTAIATAQVRASIYLPVSAHGLPAGMTLLPTLGGDTTAYDVNDDGAVVGVSVDGGGNPRAFLWLPEARYGLAAGMLDLGTLGGATSRAFAINDFGAVAGVAKNAAGEELPALWLPSPMLGLPAGWNALGTLGGASGEAVALNNAGTVVGWSQTAGGVRHAFRWKATGGMTDLSVLAGYTHSAATAVDDLGTIVGYCENAASTLTRAFVHYGAALVDVATLLPGASGLDPARAVGIANDGRIAIQGFAGALPAAIRLTPVVPPGDVISREMTVAIDDEGTNDVVSRELTIGIPHPDLEHVSDSLVMPQQGLPGAAFVIQYSIVNGGSKDATGSWLDRIYLSPNNTVGNDTLLDSASYAGPLLPGATYTATRQLVLPTTPGAYWVVIVVDALGAVDEGAGESDNTLISSQSFQVLVGPRPNLIVTSVVPPVDHVKSGTNPTIQITVKNQSTSAATQSPAWRDSAFLTTGSTLGNALKNEIFLGDAGNPLYLPAQASYTSSFPIALPKDISGTYRVAIVTDSRKPSNSNQWVTGAVYDVAEESEVDNVSFSAPFIIDLEDQPDLVPAIGLVVSNAASGTSIDVPFTITNQQLGITDVNAANGNSNWSDRIYLSQDANGSVSAGDIVLATVAHSGSPLAQNGSYATIRNVFLPAGIAGNWYVKVGADALAQVSEFGFESNNVIAKGPISIVASVAPNLKPMSVAPNGPAYFESPLSITWDVDNTGNNTVSYSATWADRIYLSVNQTLETASDVLLGTYSQSAAPDGATWKGSDYTRTVSVIVPGSLAVGTPYYVLVAIDHANAVYEAAGENDNVLSSATTISAQNAPSDLVPAVNFAPRDMLPASGAAGQSLTATWKVTNSAPFPTSSASWKDRLYLATAPDLSGTEWQIGSFNHSGVLAPAAAYVVEIGGTVPLVAPGSYFLVVVTDSGDTVHEDANEGNNVAAAPFTVTTTGADLTVTNVTPSVQLNPGDPINVTWTATNAGNAGTPAANWIDAVWLDPVGSTGASVKLGEKTHVGTLDAGLSSVTSAAFVPPINLAGAYDVRVVADSKAQVFETNESNNDGSAGTVLNVAGLPSANLVVGLVDAPASVSGSHQLGVTWRVDNVGPGATSVASWIDAIYLSTDEILNVNQDYAVGLHEHSAPLPAGAQTTISATFQVPAGISGSHFVFVVADSSGSVPESSSESDNVGHDPVLTAIALADPCDLVVSAVQLNGGAIRGQLASFQWTTTNASTKPALAGWSDALYLSVDAAWDDKDVLVGHVGSSVTQLAAGAQSNASANLLVPLIDPGNYFVIVRGDAFNSVLESNEINNVATGATPVAVTAVPIVIGPNAISLAVGQQSVFELDLSQVPPDTSVRIDLDHGSNTAWTELYLRRANTPTTGQFDQQANAAGTPDQSLTIPDSAQDLYYLLARNTKDQVGATTSANLVVTLLPASLDSIDPPAIGAGVVTIELRGAGLSKVTAVELRDSFGVTLPALEERAIDGTRRLALFDATGFTLGACDVIAQRPSGPLLLAGGLTVSEPTPAVGRLTVVTSPNVKKGHAGTATLQLINESNVNLAYAGVVVGIMDDPAITISTDTPASAPLARNGGRFVFFEARNLGPSQTASTNLQIAVAGDYGGTSTFELPIGVAGRAMSRGELVNAGVAALAEDLRGRVLASPDSPAGLLELASDAAGWWSLYLATQGFDSTGAVTSLPVGSLAADLYSIFDPAAPVPNASLASQVAAAYAAAVCAADPGLCAPAVAMLLSDSLGGAIRTDAPVTLLSESLADALVAPACSTGDSEITALVPGGTGGIAAPTICPPTPTSDDPNDKRPPIGFGAEKIVGSQNPLEYTIFFENVPEAMAPAGEVVITDQLAPEFDVSSFRLGEIRFGQTVLDVPPNAMTYSKYLDLTSTHGVILEVFAGFDAASNSAVWKFKSLDPATGAPPLDAFLGFLPPNNTQGDGAGAVVFSVMAHPSVPPATSVQNRAKVIFDSNKSIETKTADNKLDVGAPQSAIVGAPTLVTNGATTLNWVASDSVADATGIARVVAYVSKDGGPYVPWMETTSSGAEFVGVDGSTYSFFTVAVDNAGNVEAKPPQPDSVISFGPDCNQNGIADFVEIANGSAQDCDGNGVPDACQPDPDGNGIPDVCQSLRGDVFTASASAGGTQVLTLDAGASHAGRLYLLIGSATGTSPGIPAFGYTVPLNFDAYLEFTAFTPNSSILQNSLGVLGPAGTATAYFKLPPATNPIAAGLKLHHAYVLLTTSAIDFVSNPVPVTIVP